MKITFQKNRVLTFLCSTFIVLLLGNILAQYCLLHLNLANALGIVPLFHFDKEGNLPTLFSGLLLGIAAALSFIIAVSRKQNSKQNYRHWFLISAILSFLGIDEVATIHDKLDPIIMARFDTSGLVDWPWVIPYSILSIVVLIVFLPFFLKLPVSLKFHLGISAGLYLAGAIGLEMVAAQHAESFSNKTLTYAVLMTIEECMEMIAVILVISGLLSYIVEQMKGASSEIKFA